MSENTDLDSTGYFELDKFPGELSCGTCGARVLRDQRTLSMHTHWHVELPRKVSSDAASQVGGRP